MYLAYCEAISLNFPDLCWLEPDIRLNLRSHLIDLLSVCVCDRRITGIIEFDILIIQFFKHFLREARA